MLEDLVKEYIEAYHKADIQKMILVENSINGLGMSSIELHRTVREYEQKREEN